MRRQHPLIVIGLLLALLGCDEPQEDAAPGEDTSHRATERSEDAPASAQKIERYRKALESDPDDTGARTLLAVTLASNGQLEEATEEFREIVRRRPHQAQAHFNLANTLFARKEFAEAAASYREAIARDPEHIDAHNNLAVALKELGHLDEAHAALQQAERLRRADAPRAALVEGARDEGVTPTTDPLDTLVTPAVEARRSQENLLLDPAADGWQSEVIAEDVKHLLELLLAHLATPEKAPVAEVATEDVAVGRLRPERLEEAFRSPSLSVLREAFVTSARRVVQRGHAALVSELSALATPLRGAKDIRTKVKIVRVDMADTTATASIAILARTPEHTITQQATWRCHWEGAGDGPVLLRAIHLEATDYEEVVATGPRWFADATEAVLGDSEAFTRQLLPGLNHWLTRIDRTRHMHVFARSGLALGDVNGDGLDDLYVCQPGGLPNRLFVQQLNGTCQERSREAGVDWLDHTGSALLVDLDNDGDQDLVLATIPGVLFLSNRGDGHFERRAVFTPRDIDLHSLSAIDYDADGDLDLYLCVDFSTESSQGRDAAVGFLYHDANDGGANVLLRNDIDQESTESGEWRFTDVTADVGLDTDNRRHSLAAAWEDYDNDGDPDLYVANDYGKNCLYRNDDGRFVNVAEAAGVVDTGSGMSVSWGDYDRDGWVDLYVGNMFSSAGSRVTRQAAFRGAGESTRALYQRFAKGNTLLHNQGDGTFLETSAEAGVEMGRWAWSSLFADIDNDGWEDLLVANGYITTEDTGDL